MAETLGKAKSAAEVRALLKDADVSATDEWGSTALHHAALNGAPAEVITALLEAGADVRATDEEGFTALHCAANNGAPAEVITSAGARLIAARCSAVYPYWPVAHTSASFSRARTSAADFALPSFSAMDWRACVRVRACVCVCVRARVRVCE